ncbi:MAG: rhamnulokinase [Vicinamibacterales bacterium]|nr:rhamnulokinase [Vicinamibacterales bacterium]
MADDLHPVKAPLERAYLAVDLGAASGRVMLGRLSEDALELEELHRFAQPVAFEGGHERWMLDRLLTEVMNGLHAVGQQQLVDPAEIRSVGVDGWGVDYGLLDDWETLIENPVCYRDPRTDGMLEALLSKLPAQQIYARTGIQFMPINTSVQILAQIAAGEWPTQAKRLLMIPDLIHRHLSGVSTGEVTNASTTQLLHAGTREWDAQMLRAVGVAPEIMPSLVQPGTRLGCLLPEYRASTGLNRLEVVVPATHDTASAVAGTPLSPGWAFLSSGTWSLLGIETSDPVFGDEAQCRNVTNEAGVYGTNRLLKNVMGLWMLESCRRIWESEGIGLSHKELLGGLQSAVIGDVHIDVDDMRFLNPKNMVREISSYLVERGQAIPSSPVGFARVILESLALRCAQVLDDLMTITSQKVRGIHVIGGGSRNNFLNQALASATGLAVRAGPVEATTIGNIMVQAIADDALEHHSAARTFVANTSTVRVFQPRDAGRWAAARKLFRITPT